MNNFLKRYEVTITTKAPVYIGSGKQISKKEYIYDRREQKVYYPIIHKMVYEFKRCNLIDKYENFILSDNRLYLVDWEFSGNNDPIYDIACFGNDSFDEALQLLEEYYEYASPKEYQRLYAWRMFQCLQWHLVAKYKHEVGLSEELVLDFDFFANEYLSQAKELFQGYLNVSKGE